MNKSKIEWCDYTWNPVTGCLHGCEFCYAKRIDKRFGDGNFEPTLHFNRLKEPLLVKKPSKIFVGSMADLFGDWAWKDVAPYTNAKYHRNEVVRFVLDIIKRCPQHTFIFLTKNPKGMQGIDFPDNCWCGTSVENQEKANERLPELVQVKSKTLFVSYEPALKPIDFNPWIEQISWLIIGAQTGPGAVKPEIWDLLFAIQQARQANISLFVKDNCKWSEEIREWPREESHG